MRQRLSSVVAACAAVLLALAQPGAAQSPFSLSSPSGPSNIVAPANLAPLLNQMVAAVTKASQAVVDGRDVQPTEVMASAAPPNVTSKVVAQAIGTVLASALTQTEILSTLGDPKIFPYGDGVRTALYRFPVNVKDIKGTCIFVHGCKHDPYSWFYKSKKCPLCTGLPEEVSHSKQCLARGYAVLALMSINREYRNRCFSSSGPPETNDQPSNGVLVRNWVKKYKLYGKPLYMFGISSGASFAVKFPKTMTIQGLVSEVNQPWEDAWGVTDGNGKLTVKNYPPTAWYMMQRDPQTEAQIKAAVRILKKNKVPGQYIYVPERPVTKGFLAQRSVYITPAQSATIQKALKKIGVIDANGFVQYDVRKSIKWTKQLPLILPWLKRESPYYNLISDESQIWQELNLAYSQHEIVSDYVRPTLIWLEGQGKGNLTELAQQYSLNNTISCLTEKKEGC